MNILQVVIEDVMTADEWCSLKQCNKIRNGIGVKGISVAFDGSFVEEFLGFGLCFGIEECDGGHVGVFESNV